MKKSIITALAALAVVFTASAVLAGPGWGRGGYGPGACPGPGYGSGPGYARQAPQLTEEQQAKLTELQQKHFTAMNELRDEMFQKRTKLDALLVDPDAEKSDVDAAIKAVNEVRDKIFTERIEYRRQLAQEFGFRGPINGRGPHHGRMYGQGYGRGGYGPGNCPGWDYDGGYHMGPRW